MDMTDALRNYVSSKLERVERHFDHVIDAEVVLEVSKLLRKAEATVHLSGRTVHAEAEHEDMYAAIDAMVDKLDRQTRKFKEKITDHHNREALRMNAAAAPQ
jgi:putative sigma-54 modulation protein